MRHLGGLMAMLALAACSGPGEGNPTPADAAAPDVTAMDAGVPEVGTPDVGAPDAPRPECATNTDCASPRPVCDRMVGRCYGCVVDADCPSGRLCNLAHSCIERACTPGEQTCVDETRQTICDARGSARLERPCGTGETCRDGRCQPQVCAPGTSTCAATGIERRVCNASGSGTDVVPCPAGQGCSNGICTAMLCTPGARSCRTATVVEVCNDAGTGTGGFSCPSPASASGLCSSGSCVFRCNAGFEDCDREAANGCEAMLTSVTCGRACAAGQVCREGACAAGTPTTHDFRVTALASTGCVVIANDPPSGDDHGGIAVSADQVLYTGDDTTVRASASALSGLTSVGRIHDGLVNDVSNGDLYVLMNASGAQPAPAMIEFRATQLARLDAAGALTATRIPLSTPIVTFPSRSTSAVFSGAGLAVIYAGGLNAAAFGSWYRIDLPSGLVTPLGAFLFPEHIACENWASWGIAEASGGELSVLYVQSTTAIARMRLSDRAVSTARTFTSLGDACSIGFSARLNRWYWHSERSTEFSMVAEQLGTCDATWTASAP
jgi:hypothetical protein